MNRDTVNAAVLIVEAYRQGIDLSVQGPDLLYRPKSAMTPELAARLKAEKSTLVDLLHATDTDKTPDPGSPVDVLSSEPERPPVLPDSLSSDGQLPMVDGELDRFVVVTGPTPDGLGWYVSDVSEAADEGTTIDAEQIVPTGSGLLGWYQHHLSTAEACRPWHPKRSAELRAMMVDALPTRWRSWYKKQAPLLEFELGLPDYEAELIALRQVVERMEREAFPGGLGGCGYVPLGL